MPTYTIEYLSKRQAKTLDMASRHNQRATLCFWIFAKLIYHFGWLYFCLLRKNGSTGVSVAVYVCWWVAGYIFFVGVLQNLIRELLWNLRVSSWSYQILLLVKHKSFLNALRLTETYWGARLESPKLYLALA